MQDKYKCFAELEACEKGNFVIHCPSARASAMAVIAPHGGKIEPGTMELAKAIAGSDLSFYAFEGIKSKGNGDLHITSHRFDEPKCIALITSSPSVVTIHGRKGEASAVFIGGLDKNLGARIQASLVAEGFVIETKDKPSLQGLDKDNICNKSQSGCGVQLELTKGLRDSLLGSRDRFDKFVSAVRGCIT